MRKTIKNHNLQSELNKEVKVLIEKLVHFIWQR
jgi:hypothetical protein